MWHRKACISPERPASAVTNESSQPTNPGRLISGLFMTGFIVPVVGTIRPTRPLFSDFRYLMISSAVSLLSQIIYFDISPRAASIDFSYPLTGVNFSATVPTTPFHLLFSSNTVLTPSSVPSIEKIKSFRRIRCASHASLEATAAANSLTVFSNVSLSAASSFSAFFSSSFCRVLLSANWEAEILDVSKFLVSVVRLFTDVSIFEVKSVRYFWRVSNCSFKLMSSVLPDEIFLSNSISFAFSFSLEFLAASRVWSALA